MLSYTQTTGPGYPMAFVFERGGYSVAAPAILHTSANGPVLVLAIPSDLIGTALVPDMGVVLISLYLIFVGRSVLREVRRPSDSSVSA